MPITQKEVAAEAGVSQTVVARVMMNHPDVAKSTRERVKETARRLGYNSYSNLAARQLIARRYKTLVRHGVIALLMPAPSWNETPLVNVPFYNSLIHSAEACAAESDVDVLLCAPHTGRLPRLINNQQVDGVFCLGGVDDAMQKQLGALDLPVVSFGYEMPIAYNLLPAYEEGSYLATRHLIEQGHQRIAYLGMTQDGHSRHAQHVTGYQRALREANLPTPESLVEATLHAPDIASGVQGMERLLQREEKFSGLVCFNDLNAMGAVQCAHHQGLRVPQELSVVGFDDVSEQYAFQPTLTTVSYDRTAIGRRALALINGADDSRASWTQKKQSGSEIVPVELIARDSTAPPPLGNA